MSLYKPIICLDFDGVIHSYEKGWQNGEIYGTIISGFLNWAWAAKDRFRLVIYSSRSKDKSLRDAMVGWLMKAIDEWSEETSCSQEAIRYSRLTISDFEFSHEKPPAFITIDDRAIQFRGDWRSPELSLDAISSFKPWMTK